MIKSVLASFIICGIFLATQLAEKSFAAETKQYRQSFQTEEAQYLPRPEAVAVVSLGYKNALANLLWFNTISYFGKHFRSDGTYRYLKTMCSLTTDLNPKLHHVYDFCAMMLAWEAKDPEAAIVMLTRAQQHFPNEWRLLYLRGFFKTYFLHDSAGAKEDFIAAAKLPGAQPFVIKLAAKEIADLESPETAIAFLEQTLENTSDPTTRYALKGRILKLRKRQSS